MREEKPRGVGEGVTNRGEFTGALDRFCSQGIGDRKRSGAVIRLLNLRGLQKRFCFPLAFGREFEKAARSPAAQFRNGYAVIKLPRSSSLDSGFC
ncbi:MAG: hypothetical protein H0T95_10035 [Chthoniobacterales bacterium]|nr:hypothetical protein [Chthoniobacterales bacterium]